MTRAKQAGIALLAIAALAVAAVAALALVATRTPSIASGGETRRRTVDQARPVRGHRRRLHRTAPRPAASLAGGLSMARAHRRGLQQQHHAGRQDRDERLLRWTSSRPGRCATASARDGATALPCRCPTHPTPSSATRDVAALYAYFMHGRRARGPGRTKAPDIAWPLSMRWPLAIWRRAFGPGDEDRHFDVARYADSRIALGAYLVQGVGHCGACHTSNT